MSISEYCNREVVVIGRDESVVEAAKLMREQHVGSVIVVKHVNHEVLPIGILTDRDIVVELVAKEADPAQLKVADVMAAELLMAEESEEVMEVLQRMRLKGVRRIPVVDVQGSLVGIFSMDDMLELIAEQLHEVVGVFRKEVTREERGRTV